MTDNPQELATLLKAASKMLVFTGAGVSTESGIPDFRGPHGLWKRKQPVSYQDFMNSEEARIEHWRDKLEGWPAMVAARPNAVHRAIVQLERANKVLIVMTQNIDGLHSVAGTSAQRLIELHGTNLLVECQSCRRRGDPEPQLEFFRLNRRSPRCECGGFLKMATISFGQSLDPDSLERATEAAEGTDLVVALGSTLSVYPAAGFPLLAARRGVPYVIVNSGVTEHDAEPTVALRLEGRVEDLFPPAVETALS